MSKYGALSTFIKALFKIKAKDGHTLFYRGHSDDSYLDVPSIYRKNESGKRPYIESEHKIFREIIMKCPEYFLSCNSAFEHLVIMQHYDLPTRLLDITENPLVALYFACKGGKGKVGEVIIYEVPNDEVKFYSSDTVSVVANLAKRPNDISVSNLRLMSNDEINEDKSYSRLVHEIQQEKPYFKKEIELIHIESVFCVKPKLDNKRVMRQDGAFFIFGINDTKLDNAQILNKYYKMNGNEKITMKIAINGKKKILIELAELSITEAKLFPEIDKVATYLKEKLNNI